MSFATNTRVKRAVSFARAMSRLYRERDIPFMAGSIAYAGFVSLIPAVLLLLIVASVVGGAELQQSVLALSSRYLTPTSQGVLQDAIAQLSEEVRLSVVALLALLWTALKVFRTLDRAFSELYGVERAASLVEQFRNGVVVAVGMTVAILVMLVAALVLALASSRLRVGLASRAGSVDVLTRAPVIEVLSVVGLVAGLTVSFLPMYYVFPGVRMTIRDAVPGALVAAVGWTLLQGLFQMYVSLSSVSSLYGIIGGLILFITWLYFGAIVVLLGVATNVVLSADRPPSVVDE